MPFGYGPASKLLAIVRHAAGAARFVFVGEGSALELVSRERELFEDVLAANPADPAATPSFRDADGVLSLMDRDAGVAAAREGKSLFVLDSLLWMRPEVPEAFRAARVYWAQAFPGLDVGAYRPRPTVLGPLIAPPAAAAQARRDGLVLSLGGSAAPDDRRALFRAYARLVLRAVLDAGLLERFGRVTVLGGAETIEALRGAGADPRLDSASLSPALARERMARAAAVVTAPGLTTALECFADRTPTWFLPPQNYSQWCILRRLRDLGLGQGSLHWEDLPRTPRLADRLPPAGHEPLVRDTIARLVEAPEVETMLAGRLGDVGQHATDRVARQTSFFGSLGPCGLDEVVSTLRSLGTSGPQSQRARAPGASAISSRRSSPWTS